MIFVKSHNQFLEENNIDYRGEFILGGHSFCIKTFDEKFVKIAIDRDREILANEIKILKLMDEEFVPKLLEVHENENALFYVSTAFNACNLKQLLAKRRLSILQIKKIIKRLSEEVYILHTQYGIIHADIKEENILVDDSCQVYLIDFGSATFENADDQKLSFSAGATSLRQKTLLKRQAKDDNIAIFTIETKLIFGSLLPRSIVETKLVTWLITRIVDRKIKNKTYITSAVLF